MSRLVNPIRKDSAVLILKFDINEEKLDLVQDEDFQIFKVKLECITVRKGGGCKYFTQP